MRHYGITWYCALCGGEGHASYKDASRLLSGNFYHKDQSICSEVIAQKHKEEEKVLAEKQLVEEQKTRSLLSMM
jgi:hypothetical protein